MNSSARQALGATVLYLAATCAMTWPLITVMHRELTADLGDPVLNCWILLWTSGQVLSFLTGNVSALSSYWHGNIFYPEPLTLAYSEHLTAQMLQALPVLAATDNVILAYNLLVISTFVLSGLGTFLLVRDITGRPLAAFVAGLAFAFAPYRFDQLSHVQVLSAQWMPFVLYGFRRYLEAGRRRALVGASAALVAQNLSCGYYALFFTPFAVAYVIYELVVRRRLRDWRAWRAFAMAGIVVAVVSLPFFTPYLEVRNNGLGVRALGEVTSFSADVHAFATAPLNLRLWGDRVVAFPRPEGQAFPGFTILLLALTGVAAGLLNRKRHYHPPLSAWRQALVGILTVVLLATLFAIASVMVTGSFSMQTGGGWMVWHHIGRALVAAVVLSLALAVLLRRGVGDPGTTDAHSTTPWAFCAVAALTAAVLAMGPEITVMGKVVAAGPYGWLMDYVPGFDGLRVPARYVMLVALFLAVLAGLGAEKLLAGRKRFGTAVVAIAGVLILVESWPRTFETNVRTVTEGLELTPRELNPGRRLPPIYKTIRDSEQPVVLLEFPFGSPAWDLHSVFYAGAHRRPLINGYSGFFPESHQHLWRQFSARQQDPPAAWRALLATGATHVLVHEAAFPEGRQKGVTDWLLESGAHEILADGTDRLFIVR